MLDNPDGSDRPNCTQPDSLDPTTHPSWTTGKPIQAQWLDDLEA